MWMRRTLLAALLALLALPAAALAQTGASTAPVTAAQPTPSRQTAAQILSSIDQQLKGEVVKGFGGALIIKQGRRILLAKGYGYANREARVPFTPDTIAQIASVTKGQTAAVIGTLIAEGKVSLDDQVGKFVPEAPEPGRSRTVAQLLTHSSGLGDTCTGDFEPQSEAMLVRTCLARPLAYPVGEDNYSNLGYSVLALIIQRTTGKSWEQAVRERVWEPLGMTDIGVQFPGRSDTTFARGYQAGVEQPLLSRSIAALRGDDWALRGNGSFLAPSTTMIRFLDGILDPHSAFPERARKLLLQPVPGQQGKVQEGFGLVFAMTTRGS